MRRFPTCAIVSLLAAWAVWPAVSALAQPALLAGARPEIDQIAGVYKHRFANGNVQGDHYQSEDVFEVVKLSPNSVYFRIQTQFYNGHECGLWGVAELETDALVYRESATHAQGYRKDPVQPCVMKFTVNKDGVIFNDVGGICRMESCGARGGYGFANQLDFAFKDRRRIRYMPLILASKEYAAAIKDHAGLWRPSDDR